MKIGIDARFAVRDRRGIGNYVLHLVRGLSEIGGANQYILYVDRDDVESVLPVQSNFTTKKLLPSNYFVWEQFILPARAKKDGLDILHCPGNTAPVHLSSQIRLIVSVMDVMYLKSFSELARSVSLYQRLGRVYRKTFVPRAIERASRVITISDFSRNDIISHFKSIDPHSIAVTHLAANKSFHPADRKNVEKRILDTFGVNGKYILVLGGSDPRKNTELVIRTFLELKSKGAIEEKLVISGIPNWRKTHFFEIVQRSSCGKEVIFTDFVAEEDLVLLYNGAKVFLYPSLYEGFGIPLLEAMACGVPVISSDRTSIPEIAGDAALLIDPADGEELRKELTNLLDNEDLRNELIERGFRQLRKFSWRKMAEKTLGVYESVYREEN